MAKTCSHIRCKRKTSSCHECDIEVQSWYLLLSDCCIKYGSTFWWSIENCCDCTFFFLCVLSLFSVWFMFGTGVSASRSHWNSIIIISTPDVCDAMCWYNVGLSLHIPANMKHTHTHKIKSIEACQSFALLYVHHFII